MRIEENPNAVSPDAAVFLPPAKWRHWGRLLLTALTIAGVVPSRPGNAAQLSWQTALMQSRGQTVDWYLDGAPPEAEEYLVRYLAPRIKELYAVTLRRVPPGDCPGVFDRLWEERREGSAEGT